VLQRSAWIGGSRSEVAGSMSPFNAAGTLTAEPREGREKEIPMAVGPPVMMNAADEGTLGSLIGNRNIYPKNRLTAAGTPAGGAAGRLMQLVAAVASQIEEDTYEIGYWKFKDRSLHIGKAIRIPYNYIDESGNMVLAHILVGYEGEGGE
jgi:hypothetical protein